MKLKIRLRKSGSGNFCEKKLKKIIDLANFEYKFKEELWVGEIDWARCRKLINMIPISNLNRRKLRRFQIITLIITFIFALYMSNFVRTVYKTSEIDFGFEKQDTFFERQIPKSSAITLLGYLDMDGNAGGVFVSGDVAYVVVNGVGLVCIDISDPTNSSGTFKEIGHYDSYNASNCVYVLEDVAYVCAEKSFLCINISDPTDLALIGIYYTNGFSNKIFVSGAVAYVIDGFNLVCVNISDPTNSSGTFKEIGQCSTNLAEDIYVTGDVAYIADYDGLRCINISDPTDLDLIGVYYTSGVARAIDVSGDIAYVLDTQIGLICINISDPTDLVEIGHIQLYDVWGISVSSHIAYVICNGPGGNDLISVNISDPTNSTGTFSEIEHLSIDLSPNDIYVSGDVAYIANSSNGLVCLDILDTDLDGIPNNTERLIYNTDPNDSDSDNDGLSDWEEINIYLTDPNDSDSDDDGFEDNSDVYPNNPLMPWIIILILICIFCIIIVICFTYIKLVPSERKLYSDIEKEYSNGGKIQSDNQTKYYSDLLKKLKSKKIYFLMKKRAVLEEKIILDLREHQIRNIKKIILDLGTKYTRLQVGEISEKCGFNEEQLIIITVLNMIDNKEIYAEYFESTKSVAFNQQANIEYLEQLDNQFEEWENKEKSKKGKKI